MSEDLFIGYLSTLYHTSFLLRGSGHLNELGINASWKLFPNGPAMMEAFGQGELDLGYIGLPPAMIGIARGLKVRCVAGGHVEGTVLIGSESCQVKETASDALVQFKGKTIGTPRRGQDHPPARQDVAFQSQLRHYRHREIDPRINVPPGGFSHAA